MSFRGSPVVSELSVPKALFVVLHNDCLCSQNQKDNTNYP
jgi:hypothetical protein